MNMNKEFKIIDDKIKSLTHKDLKLFTLIIVITIVSVESFIYLQFSRPEVKETGLNTNLIFGVSLALTVTTCSLILWYSYGFKKIFYSNYKVLIDNEQIKKIIDLDNLNLNVLQRLNWERTKRIYPQNNISIKWTEINKIEETNDGINLKTINSNSLTKSGQLFIPKEMDNYSELYEIIKQRTSSLK